MSNQLEYERRLIGDAGFKTLLKEMVTIPGNRNRAIISVLLMIFQQMTGVNAIVRSAPSEIQVHPAMEHVVAAKRTRKVRDTNSLVTELLRP